MTQKKLDVWVLADDRAGNYNQALGIADAMGFDYIVKKIVYNGFAFLPNFIKGVSLIGLDKEESSPIIDPWPDVVISVGRKTAPIALYIKSKSAGKTKVVQIMSPDYRYRSFDLLVLPEHDKRKKRKNIITTLGAPNKINQALLSKERRKWNSKVKGLPKPRVALLVGGNTKKGDFTISHAKDLAEVASIISNKNKGSFLVTTSRRTSDDSIKELRDGLTGAMFFYDCKSPEENPYLGFLALADKIIVTGDSISMISEACSTGKPVYIYAVNGILPCKHKAFHKRLYKEGVAKPLMLGMEEKPYKYKPLQEAKRIADEIKKRFG